MCCIAAVYLNIAVFELQFIQVYAVCCIAVYLSIVVCCIAVYLSIAVFVLQFIPV